MTIASSTPPKQAASAARARSGRLFSRLRWAATTCCRRPLVQRARISAAVALLRWPKRPPMRAFTDAG